MQRQLQDKLPYHTWVNGGFLLAPHGQAISFRHVARVMVEYVNRYYVQLVAHDRYPFRWFGEEVNDIGLSMTFRAPAGQLQEGWAAGNCSGVCRAVGAACSGVHVDGRGNRHRDSESQAIT